MEYDLIQSFKSAIHDNNKQYKNQKDKQIKDGISLYAGWMQVLMWTLIIFFIVSVVAYIALVIYRGMAKEGNGLTILFFILSVIALLAAAILQNVFERRYTKEGLEVNVRRLEILKNVIISVYSENSLFDKVEALIGIYKDKIDRIEAEESKRNKVIGSAITVIGVIAVTSFEGMDKLGLNIEGWLALIFIIISIGLIILAPLYLIASINPIKDKYSIMLDRLRHLRIMLIMEADKDNPTIFNETIP